MPDLDLTELRRQIEQASPKHGPGRIVKLEREYAKAILAEIETAEARAMRVHTSLMDPLTVYVNMMYGQIAKPSVRQIIHIYGREALLAELAPGHIDMMVSPESLDEFMERNPLPEEPADG